MSKTVIPIYIGYDTVETVAYNVLCHSIISRSSLPVSITPIYRQHLNDIHSRKREGAQSNDFSFTRFLIPYLQEYKDWAIFMDCDILCLDDIAKLWACRNDNYALMCVKHDQKITDHKKYLGIDQIPYRRKNWSSVMMFNCEKCKTLTPDNVDVLSGLELHQFTWLTDDQIGEFDNRWNYLVNYEEVDSPALVHFTNGGPWFKAYISQPYAREWWNEFYNMVSCKNYDIPEWVKNGNVPRN